MSAWVVTTCRGPSTTDSGHDSSRLPPACHSQMKPAFRFGTPCVICRASISGQILCQVREAIAKLRAVSTEQCGMCVVGSQANLDLGVQEGFLRE